MWCNPCRAVGMIHCAHPDECGNMLSDQAAADNWKAWIDDLPLDAGFAEGIGQVQDFISGTVARAEAAETALTAERAKTAKLVETYWLLRSFAVHDNHCKVNKPPKFEGPCSCGLAEALADGQARAAIKEAGQ